MKQVFSKIKKFLNIVIIFQIFLLCANISTVFGAEEPVKKEAETKKPITFTIYGQGGYTYNFNNPPNKINDFRVFDQKADTLLLDLIQLTIDKDTLNTDRFGFRIKGNVGETSKYIHSYGLGNINNSYDLTEAFIRYKVPLGSGLDVEAGKFATFIGAEVIEANANPNYSRSFLFNYAIPFTHTGLRAKYNFTDQFNVMVHAVNGWDDFKDNNQAKTFGLSFGVNPSEKINMNFNLMTGPEQLNNNSNNRFLFDWVGTIKPDDKWLFLLNYDYGTEQNVPGIGNSKWSGFSGVARRDITKKFSLALRAEIFKDNNGARTGIPQTLKEITFTPEYRITNEFLVRPEYRYDTSNVQAFNGGTTSKQSTLGIGIMYQHQW
jgi:hypothetical protein